MPKSFTAPFSGKNAFLLLTAILLLCCVNVWHPHLWGPDEPREAEIAREILQGGDGIVPTFNRIPFVEKPPLYYDLGAIALSFSYHPGSIRMVSALLGFLMIAALLIFAWKFYDAPTAFCSAMLCLAMPQFFRAAHWILLDIGVGATVTAALCVYGVWMMKKEEKGGNLLLAIFFFLAALAFLTKGFVTTVYLGVVILPLMLRRKNFLPFPLNWTLFFFLIPVGIWIYLLYRAGGVYYLHEHFINNIVGRLLHRRFILPGSPITIADVGHNSPLLFYLERSPAMFGAAIALIPLALAADWRQLRLPFFRVTLTGNVRKIWDALTAPKTELTPEKKTLRLYLLSWSFVPLIVFSIPAIKEVTYLLPSYAGLALLLADYLTGRLNWKTLETKKLWTAFLLPLAGIGLSAQFLSGFSLTLFSGLCGMIFLWLLFCLIRTARRREWNNVVLPALAGLIAGVIIGNTPALMVRTRLDRKCYCQLTPEIWEKAGDRPVFMPSGEESIRGAIPFYGKRDITMLTGEGSLERQLRAPGNWAVLMRRDRFRKAIRQDSSFRQLVQPLDKFYPDYPKKADEYVLLLSRTP